MCFNTKYVCVVLLSVCVEINSRHINIGQHKLDQPNLNLKTALENVIESAGKAKTDASNDQMASLAKHQTEVGNDSYAVDDITRSDVDSIMFLSETLEPKQMNISNTSANSLNNEKMAMHKTDSTFGNENSLRIDAIAVEQPMALKVVSERSTESAQQSKEPQLTKTTSAQPVPDELCLLLKRQGLPLVAGCLKTGRLGIWN
ncbi:uncharacterized protein LOC128235331 [Mya arenaria]|uniref:uncharacterized protein LOC128235331 n=1 Tax=Mya arenaria TaxID=6604 RepID=UPI0022E50DAA|nr:uncharacterized protein LOC128235331 [Mya arenaria]